MNYRIDPALLARSSPEMKPALRIITTVSGAWIEIWRLFG